ncbi:MAG: sulfotransferase [Cyanobacteriota bacterium]|nr:sulfotransferase [Cyanobacteriota bacterium]
MNNNFALIIGAMKCGTTSLFHYLAEHPQITAASDKEPHFFSEESNSEKKLDKYRSLWQWQPEHRVALEASTTYTMHPKYEDVPERIARVKDADFRFIYIMRHPFLRVESHIRHLLAEGYQNTVEVIEEHLAFSEYARQLDRYVELFGRDRIHLLLLEDLQNNPQTELCRICQFLGVDSDYIFGNIDLVMNSKSTLNLHPTIRQIYRIPTVKSIGRLIPPKIRQKLYNPLKSGKIQDVRLSDRDREIIFERLQPDLAKLQATYGVDVAQKWKLPLS